MNLALSFAAQLLHIALTLAAAPTLVGIIHWIEARLTGRVGPPPLQPWRDLSRLLRKEPVLAESASDVTITAPLISAAAIAIAAALVPSFALGMSLAPFADLLVIIGLLALSRGALALANMDAGTALGGMTASREMNLASLTEPALLLVVFVLALLAGSSNLDLIAAMQQESATDWRTPVVLAAAATLLVAFVNNSPRTTPLEFSGRDLALIEATDALRLLLWFNLIGAIFLPFGMAPSSASPLAWLVGLASWLTRTLLLAVAAAVVPIAVGRLRMTRIAQILGVAILLGLLAVAYLFAGMGYSMTSAASLAAASALALSLALLCASRLGSAVFICAVQTLLTAIALAGLHWQPALIALVAFALNGVVLPLALLQVMQRSTMAPVMTARNGVVGFWLATLVLLAITIAAFTQIRPPSSTDALVLGSSIVLLGVLLIAQRSHPLAPTLGLLSSQNGLLLVVSAAPDLPLSARLVVILPLVPGLILTNAWLRP